SSPRATAARQSADSRRGSTPGGTGPAPSDLECRPDPGEGRPSGALAPHHSTPAPSLRVAAPAQTAGPLSARPAPHVAGEAGGPPPHRDSTGAGPATLGLATSQPPPHPHQPRHHPPHHT